MHPTPRFSSRRSLGTLAMLAGACVLSASVLVGCYSEGGSGYTGGPRAYVSTTYQPKTITLRDMRTGQAFWSIDVPVGRKLVLQFRDPDSSTNPGFGETYPSVMVWAILDVDDTSTELENQIPTPPKEICRIEVTLRAAPELPDSMGGGVPKREPGESTVTPPKTSPPTPLPEKK